MSVASIARRFEASGKVPIEIKDVISAVNELLFDEYIRVHGLDFPPEVVKGICHQSKVMPMVGSAIRPATEHRVIYSTRMHRTFQRLVVCKEIIHVLDPEPLRTQTTEEVVDLIDKMRKNNVSFDTSSANGLRVVIDKLAEWQAVAILFPLSLWEVVYPRFLAGTITVQKIADIVEIPPEYVAVTMSEEWKVIREQFLSR